MTRAEREAKAKADERRAKDRERWHARKLTRGFKAYAKRKAAAKAAWQRKNAKKHLDHVQAFYERHGISGREARAIGKQGAAKHGGKPTPQRLPQSGIVSRRKPRRPAPRRSRARPASSRSAKTGARK